MIRSRELVGFLVLSTVALSCVDNAPPLGMRVDSGRDARAIEGDDGDDGNSDPSNWCSCDDLVTLGAGLVNVFGSWGIPVHFVPANFSCAPGGYWNGWVQHQGNVTGENHVNVTIDGKFLCLQQGGANPAHRTWAWYLQSVKATRHETPKNPDDCSQPCLDSELEFSMFFEYAMEEDGQIVMMRRSDKAMSMVEIDHNETGTSDYHVSITETSYESGVAQLDVSKTHTSHTKGNTTVGRQFASNECTYIKHGSGHPAGSIVSRYGFFETDIDGNARGRSDVALGNPNGDPIVHAHFVSSSFNTDVTPCYAETDELGNSTYFCDLSDTVPQEMADLGCWGG
jgi:hypothetical protein